MNELMSELMGEVIDLSNNSFIQSHWEPKEGDYIWDGFKIHILSHKYYSFYRDDTTLKVQIAYFDKDTTWKKDFRTVTCKTIDFPIITINDPLWLPCGYDTRHMTSQIDSLLKKKIGVATDLGLDRVFRSWIEERMIEVNRNSPTLILKLQWLKELCKY